MKYFVNTYASFRKGPSTTAPKWQDLPEKTVVDYLGEPYLGWSAVEYMGKLGYIANTLIEPYWETLPKNCVKIDNQTPEENDFAQYFLYRGLKQLNACGQLSICMALGLSMSDFMDTWEITNPSLFKRIMTATMRMSGTYKTDLRDMCRAYSLEVPYMETVTLDPWLKRSRYTPAVLERLTDTGYPIVGVKMDANTGRLRGSGIGHWVMVTRVIPERNGYGLVELYNPAPNRIEQYSYDEFLASARYPTGIWIPKDSI